MSHLQKIPRSAVIRIFGETIDPVALRGARNGASQVPRNIFKKDDITVRSHRHPTLQSIIPPLSYVYNRIAAVTVSTDTPESIAEHQPSHLTACNFNGNYNVSQGDANASSQSITLEMLYSSSVTIFLWPKSTCRVQTAHDLKLTPDTTLGEP